MVALCKSTTRIALVKLNQCNNLFISPDARLHLAFLLVYISSQSQSRMLCLLANKNRSCANSANTNCSTKKWTIFHVTWTNFVWQHCRPIKLSYFYWLSDIGFSLKKLEVWLHHSCNTAVSFRYPK